MIDQGMSDSRYVEIPGDRTHELPPLLLHCAVESTTDLTRILPEAEEMLGVTDAEQEVFEQRKFDLAV